MLNHTTRVYFPVTAGPGFLLSKYFGVDSGTISGAVTGEENPIPELPIAVVQTVLSVSIVIVMFASRRIRRVKIGKIYAGLQVP